MNKAEAIVSKQIAVPTVVVNKAEAINSKHKQTANPTVVVRLKSSLLNKHKHYSITINNKQKIYVSNFMCCNKSEMNFRSNKQIIA